MENKNTPDQVKDTRKVVLCRRDLADIGEAPRFCAKPIDARNTLNWCGACRARLPLWPVLDRQEAQEVMRELRVGMPVGDGNSYGLVVDILAPHEVVAYDCARMALEK